MAGASLPLQDRPWQQQACVTNALPKRSGRQPLVRPAYEAALSHLNAAQEKDTQESAALYEDLTRHYHQRLAGLQPGVGKQGLADHERHAELSLEALRVERVAAIHLRDEGRINDQVLRRIERELDLTESRITATRDT